MAAATQQTTSAVPPPAVFTPVTLPNAPKRQLGCLEKPIADFVTWVRNSENQGTLCKVATYALAFFIGTLCLITILGSPVALLMYGEWVRQEQEARLSPLIQQLYVANNTNIQQAAAVMAKQAGEMKLQDQLVTHLRQRYGALRDSHTKLDGLATAVRTSYGHLDQATTQVRNRVRELEGNLASFQGSAIRIQQLQAEVQEKTGQISAQNDKIGRYEILIHKLQADLTLNTNAIARFEGEITRLMQHKAELENEINRLKEEKATFEQLGSELPEEQRRGMETVQTEITRLREELATARNAVVTIGKQEAEQYTALNAQLQAAHTKERELGEKVATLNTELTEEKSRYAALHTLTTKLREGFAKISTEKNQLQQSISDLKENQPTEQGRERILTEALKQADSDRQQQAGIIQRLREELGASNDTATKEKKELGAMITAKVTYIDQLNQRLTEFSEAQERHVMESNMKDQEITNKTMDISQLEAKVKQLQTELDEALVIKAEQEAQIFKLLKIQATVEGLQQSGLAAVEVSDNESTKDELSGSHSSEPEDEQNHPLTNSQVQDAEETIDLPLPRSTSMPALPTTTTTMTGTTTTTVITATATAAPATEALALDAEEPAVVQQQRNAAS